MVGFQSKYYDNIPDEYVTKHGTLDIKNHNKVRNTQKYKVGDKLIILPKWNGANYATFKEIMELHEQGVVGEVTQLRGEFITLGEKGINHDHIMVKTPTEETGFHVSYYCLGYKLKK